MKILSDIIVKNNFDKSKANRKNIGLTKTDNKNSEKEPKRVLHKVISTNEFNINWENSKKNEIKEIYDRKFKHIETPKKIKLINQTSVLFPDNFYQESCQGKYFFYWLLIVNIEDFKIEDINMTITPKSELIKAFSNSMSKTDEINNNSLVIDAAFLKREMAKKG